MVDSPRVAYLSAYVMLQIHGGVQQRVVIRVRLGILVIDSSGSDAKTPLVRANMPLDHGQGHSDSDTVPAVFFQTLLAVCRRIACVTFE
jgi:hypothetical protein